MARILVVDDDPGSVDMLCRLLEKAGHTVAGASNGREALQSILKWSPDLVILDLLMPYLYVRVSGNQTVRHVAPCQC